MTLLEKLNELIEKGATAEEIQSSLGEFMIPKGTFNKVNDENKSLKSQVDTLNSNIDGLNNQIEEVKTSNMDEQELIKHQLEKAQGQITQHALEKNRLSAENKFVSAGFAQEEYASLLDQIVSEDSEQTLGLVDSFLNLTNNKIEGAKKQQVDKMLKDNLTPPKGNKLDEELDDIDALVADFNSDLD